MNGMTKEDVFRILQQNQGRLRDFGVKRTGLFGSFVRGQQRQDSDIDDVLGRRAEVVTVESLSPHMAANILNEVEDAALVA